MKKRRQKSKKRFIATWSTVLTLTLIIGVGVNVVLLGQLRTVMDGYFKPSVTRSAALTAAASNLTEHIEGEGMVLLKNDNHALPFAADQRKVNVFGWSSTNPVYGGTGSGAVHTDTAVNFLKGLELAGIKYNTQITDFYKKYRDKRPAIEIRAQDWTIPEPSMADYDAAGIFDSAKSFSDTAVVMISRSGGEGADLATSLGGKAGDIQQKALPDGRKVNVGVVGSTNADDIDASKHYLEPSNRELAMIQRVSSQFKHVVVLLNTGNVFELGWVEKYHIDSVAWIGGPGESGFKAVGKMLTGDVNPSGRTVDTWARHLLATPAVANFGAHSFTDSAGVNSGDVPTKFSGDPATRPGYQFLQYAEGIYVGYRFYETYFLGNEAGYRAAVQYPFGYGLSYTSFAQKMGDLHVSDGNISVDVTVTNTGAAAGQDAAELYSTPPYEEGGIEKSAVNLIAFGKTGLLKPGASETVTLKLTQEDLASFDDKHAGAYVLDKGSYELKLMRNAHEVIDSRTHVVPETIVYDANHKRSTDKVAATARFAGAAGDTKFLSRTGHFANFAEAIQPAKDRPMTEAERAAVRVTLPTDPNAKMPTTGANNGLKLRDLTGVGYDDPKWNKLLDQLSVDDMKTVVSLGGYQTKAIDSVGKQSTIDIDGPQGLSSFLGASVRAGAYPTAIVTASTWNSKIAQQRGQMVGYEALELGVHGWYAPGMNLHRSPFAGRNFEYYSEDSLLSSEIGAAEVSGASSEGLYTYIKHFVLNEQETFRNSRLTTWVNEQSLRELYMKPFETSVKRGHATAVMSAYNYVGGIWAGGSTPLLNGVLRSEWGFRGMVISDYFGDYGYMNADQGIANGTDMMLSTLGMFGATPERKDAQGVTNMRQATKNILYTVANSSAMFSDADRTARLSAVGGHISELGAFEKLAYNLKFQAWELLTYIIDGVIAILLALLVWMKIRKYRRLFPRVGVSPTGNASAE